MADFRIGISGIRRREPEIPLEGVQRRPWLNRATHKNIGHEVNASKGRVRALVRQRSSDLLRWTRQYVADWNVSRRREGRNARRLIERGRAQIIAGPADRIVHRLARREPAIAIGPAVIVWRAVGILATKMQFLRGIVGGPIASLVSAVHPGKDPPVQRMTLWRKADRVRIPIPPREGLNVARITYAATQ